MSTPLLIGGDCGEFVVAWSPTDYVPTPETEPEAIAADQRGGVVAFALRGYPRRTPEQISELVLLPVWVVRRRLAELGKGPPVEPPVRTKKARHFLDKLIEHAEQATSSSRSPSPAPATGA